MAHLILCSFEVGGQPYKMAELLNAGGVRTYYISLQDNSNSTHDTTGFHYENSKNNWNLSQRFINILHDQKKIATTLKNIKNEFGINAAIGMGQHSYLLDKAEIPYFFCSYGSDLDEQPFLPVYRIYRPLSESIRTANQNYHIKRQVLRSIKKASAIRISPYQLPIYKYLKASTPLVYMPHFIAIPKQSDNLAYNTAQYTTNGRYFFSSARQLWVKRPYRPKCIWDKLTMPFTRRARQLVIDALQLKGTDVVLKMFSRYCELQENKADNDLLMLIEKGPDVDATKALAQELGISEKIRWITEMPRRELANLYRNAACCFGQLDLPCLTMSTLEPLAFGTPCISHFIGKGTEAPMYEENPPILNTVDIQAGAEFMQKMANDPEERNKISIESKAWIEKYCSDRKFVEAIQAILEPIALR